jgi:GTP pyrophosphokinase
MKKQSIPFEEVFDLFAIRIIVKSGSETEKSDCWRVYSIVTDFYTPNPERLRDWISVPKGNGYESLHTTVMGPQGKWVEVQIRSIRMDDVAEKGYAAHWKYKEDTSSGMDNNLEEWIKRIRELLENPESNAIDFIDDFKLNLFSDEVFIFTPKGDMITLPSMATALDFAFDIHTQIGSHCLGAKVNHRLVPLSYKLKNGDQVEIITSKKQKPSEDWLNYVVTAKAKSRIKASLKEEKRKIAQEGKEYLIRKFKNVGIGWNNEHIQRLTHYFKLRTNIELFYNIGINVIDKTEIGSALKFFESSDKLGHNGSKPARPVNGKKITPKTPDVVVVGEDLDMNYSFAKCCNAIPGDDIFGFITINDGIKIHRTNCPNGIRLMSNYGYRIIRAKWATDQLKEIRTFPVGIKLTGIDSIGIVSNITDIISKELQVNIQSITVSSIAGAFEGSIILYIYDTAHLETLIEKIKEIKGIELVSRFHVEETLTGEAT